MNIKEAKQEIKNTVLAYLNKDEYGDYTIPTLFQRPLLLIGPPGIGKTQIMEQIARECEIGLVAYTITHHTRQSAVGLPFIKKEEYEGKEYSITEYTMSEIIASIYEKMKNTGLKEGILFIDEINCVSETLAPTMLQLLQYKTFGNQSIPQGWILVAAGNPPEYNKSVRDFDMVTLDRVRYIYVDANYYVWKEYALMNQVHPAILSFLELKPNRFYKVESDIDGMKFVTARGWDDLSHLLKLYESLHIEIKEDMVREFIHHEDIAEDFFAYYLLYKKYQDDYGIADIVDGKVSSSIYARILSASFDERISVVNLLLDELSKSFVAYGDKKYRCDSWYSLLSQYRQSIKQEGNRISQFNILVDTFEKILQKKIMEETLTKQEIHREEDLLKQYRNASLLLDSSMSDKEAFLSVKGVFDEYVNNLEKEEGLIITRLNHSFKFMEDAFSSGQEMFIFITGLSMQPSASLFISEHDIPYYDKYKEELLIGSRKAQLLDEMKR